MADASLPDRARLERTILAPSLARCVVGLGSVVRHTWVPFVVVLLLTMVFAATARHYHPEAHSLPELWRRL